MLNKKMLMVAGATKKSALKPYSRFSATIADLGDGDCGFIVPKAAGGGSQDGVYAHIEGQELYVDFASAGNIAYFISTDGVALLSVPFALGSMGGVCTVVNETTGQVAYGAYFGMPIMLTAADVFVAFRTYEHAMHFLNTGELSEENFVQLFTFDDVGKTFTFSIYRGDFVSEDVETTGAYSRFEATCAKSSDYLYGFMITSTDTAGAYKHLEGVDLYVSDTTSGRVAYGLTMGGLTNTFTFNPPITAESGICKVVNETTGDITYGVFKLGSGLSATTTALSANFLSYDDALAYLRGTGASTNDAPPIFSESNVGKKVVLSFYIEDGSSGGGGEPEPLDHHELSFVASTTGENVNFFSEISETAHPASAYKVYLNDVETQQTFTSLSFTAGDVVKIVADGVKSFPKFSAYEKDYIKEFLTPLPFVSDEDGKGYTTAESLVSLCPSLESVPSNFFENNWKFKNFRSTFNGCKGLVDIPSGLFDKNVNTTRFDWAFRFCSKVKNIPAGLFDKTTKVTTFEYVFAECQVLREIPEGLFDKNTEVTSFDSAFSGCRALTSIPSGLFDNNLKVKNFGDVFQSNTNLTSVPENLFANNTEVTDFSYAFSGCRNLSDQRIKIGSTKVTNASGFCTNAKNITVIVPAGSTTESTFRSHASTVTNLTVSTY